MRAGHRSIGPGETWFDTNVPYSQMTAVPQITRMPAQRLGASQSYTSADNYHHRRWCLDTKPNATYAVQFFSNPSGDEGKKFIGQKQVPTDGDGGTASPS